MKCFNLKTQIILYFLLQSSVQLIAQDSNFSEPILNLRYGRVQAFNASKFFETYNKPTAFRRPFLQSIDKLKSFEPDNMSYSWAAELRFKYASKYEIGITVENLVSKLEDRNIYPGLMGYDENNSPLYFTMTEYHQFDVKTIPIIAFSDYPFYENSLIYPVIGFGAGFALTEFNWRWNIYGNQIYQQVHFYLSHDETLFESKGVKFLFQPRLRLEMNVQKISNRIGKYFENVHIQFDYIYCRSKLDIFKKYRNNNLKGKKSEDVSDDMKKLFEDYYISYGGLQIMFGIGIRINNIIK